MRLRTWSAEESFSLFRPGLYTSVILLSGFTIFAAGCGGSSSSSSGTGGTGPIPGQSTTVALQLSSTANAQFLHFNMSIISISLTNQKGVTTTIFNSPTDVDFIPSNGNAAPLATVTVPQDVYTSAAISVSQPRFSYTAMLSSGSIDFSTDEYGTTPTPPVVNLAGPITVEGSAMGLTLNLLASASGTYSGAGPNQSSYSITPTFDLTPFALTTQATSPLDGKCIGLGAQIVSVDPSGKSMAVTLAGHPLTLNRTFNVAIDPSISYQGSATASSLVPGALVNLDLALLPDASYAATRIEIDDPAATNLNTGQIVQFDPSYNNYLTSTGIEQQGAVLSTLPVSMGYAYEFGPSTAFLTSARLAPPEGLPFNPVFDGESLAPGQSIAIGSTDIALTGGHWTTPTSITLVPQTLDGVIESVSNESGYTVYNVQLAPYDPIVQLNSPLGAAVTSRLNNAGNVVIYVPSSSSMLNTTPLAAGGTFRFDGLLFNDGGVLRMISDRVEDGVTQ